MARAALLCLACLLPARAQQLYTVHYHTQALPAAASPRRANDAAVAARLLGAPLSVQFRGATKWSPFLAVPPPDGGALRPGQAHTTDLFITQPLGKLVSVVLRVGGLAYNASAAGAWAPVDRLSVEVGDARMMKFGSYAAQGTGGWLFAGAAAGGGTTELFDVQDALIQEVSLAAAASSVALLFVCSLCVQVRKSAGAAKHGGGGGGGARVGADGAYGHVPGYGDGGGGGGGYGEEVAPLGGGYAAGSFGTTLPAMAATDGDGAYDVGHGGHGGAAAGGRGYTGGGGGAVASSLLAPIRVGSAPAAASVASAPDTGFRVPQNHVQAASAAAAGSGYDGSAVGGGYGGGIGAGAAPAAYGGYGGYNAAAQAPAPAYGGGSGSLDYTQPQSSGFDTFDEEEPL